MQSKEGVQSMENARILLVLFMLATIVMTACVSSERNYDYVPVEGGYCATQGAVEAPQGDGAFSEIQGKPLPDSGTSTA